MSKKIPNKKPQGDPNNVANEPEVEYQVTPKLGAVFKTITIASLEEQEEEQRRYSVSLSPAERIAYLYELNELAFGHILRDTPREKLWDRKIHIRKSSE